MCKTTCKLLTSQRPSFLAFLWLHEGLVALLGLKRQARSVTFPTPMRLELTRAVLRCGVCVGTGWPLPGPNEVVHSRMLAGKGTEPVNTENGCHAQEEGVESEAFKVTVISMTVH